jgi:glycyl-tRNA synthetase alpha chain
MMTFQQLLLRIQDYWASEGCIIQQPYDCEVGAGTMHPDTFFRALGPEPWRVAYCQPSRRPVDGRYGENPMRLYKHYQFQVILKPAPLNIQELYLGSLRAFGIDPLQHDIRFEEDNWESPTLGAAGVGWQVVMDGMEISQFTYFQQVGGLDLSAISAELTYGIERFCMFIIDIRIVYDIPWNERLSYGDVRHSEEVEHSVNAFEQADVELLGRQFNDWEHEAGRLLALTVDGDTGPVSKPLVLPAFEATLKCSHLFNVLDARGSLSVTERAAFIQRIRRLSCDCAAGFLSQRKAAGFPLQDGQAPDTKADEA